MARILFIEPDRLLGANAKKVFKRAGHDVNWYVDPQAAINSADTARPDVIILDLLLAGRSGVEFLYEFRSYPEWSRLPVIIYSDISPEEFKGANVGFTQLNIAAYHYKPTTSITELCNSIEKVAQLTRL